MMRFFVNLCTLLCVVLMPVKAQTVFPTTYESDLVAAHSISIVGATDYRPLPYYMPSHGEKLRISFDLLDAVPHQVSYKLQYCDAEWRDSELITGECQRGFASGLLPASVPSGATKLSYRQYTLELSEASNPAPLLSGNWIVSFFLDDDADNPILKVAFAICEGLSNIEGSVSAITAKGDYGAYQSVQLRVQPKVDNNVQLENGIHVMVAQNGRRDNAVYVSRPSLVQFDALLYEGSQAPVFEGGNEYSSFEILGDNQSNMGVERMLRNEQVNEAQLYPTHNTSTAAYQTNADANGRYVVRPPENLYTGEDYPSTDADYYFVDFTFYSDQLSDDLLLTGDAFDARPYSERQLHYDAQMGAYKTRLLLKGGYYSYLYVSSSSEKTPYSTCKSVGSHYQTNNNYTIMVYYRKQGERFDRLIGAKEIHN